MSQKSTYEELEQAVLERSQAAKALRESEEKYRTILDGIEDSYLEVDLSGNFKFFNASFCKLIGYSKKELIGKNNQEFVDKTNAEKLFHIFHNVYLTGKPAKGVVWGFIRKDGSKRHVEASVSLVTDSKGKPIGFRGIGRDITVRKQTLERTVRLNRLNERLLSPSSLHEKLRLVTDAVIKVFKTDFARIWTIKPGDLCDSGCIHAKVTKGAHVCRDRKHCLHLLASSGRYTHLDGGHKRVPFGCYKIGRVAAEKEPKFLTNDVTNEPKIHDHEWAKKLGLVSFAGYRLLSLDGGIMGVLALFSKNKISAEEDAQLEGIARTTAQIIHTKMAEETLRESEGKLRAIFNASPLAIVLIGRDGRILDSNEEHAGRLNMTRNQIIGECIWDLLPASVREHRKKLIDKVFKFGEPISAEDEREGIWNEFHIYPAIEDEKGKVEAVIVEALNISKRKQTEEALRDSEEKYKLLAESSADVIYKVNIENEQYSYASPSVERVFGYTTEEVLSMKIQDTLTAESYANQLEKLQETLLRGSSRGPEIMELEVVHKEGHILPIEVHVNLISDEQGNPVEILGVARDITERKRVEEEIRTLASTDSLTGTNNRRSFMEQAESEWIRCRRYNHSLSIMMIDVDHFKGINDIYGHHIGDLTLQLLTKTCLDVLRENDIFGRIGGEEFAAVLVETNEKQATKIAERLRKIISALTVKADSISFNFQVSIGVANLNDDESLMDIIKKSDQALYKAKSLGRNMVVPASEIS